MIRRLVPYAILAAVLGALLVTCLLVVRALHLPPSPLERKISEAERILYYRITHDVGPRIRLTGAEQVFKLVTHAVLPADTPYDPERRIAYGVRIQILDRARTVWLRDVYTETRQSKANPVDDVWIKENAFAREGDIEITDDRMLMIHLPPKIPPNSLCQIRLLGAPREGLFRIYNRVLRSDMERKLSVRSLAPEAATALVERNTYLPWPLLTLVERSQRLRNRWERMSAIGERGVDYATRSIYFTGYRIPLEHMAPEPYIEIDHRRWLALNVSGPARLQVVAARAPVAPSPPGTPAPATLPVESAADAPDAPLSNSISIAAIGDGVQPGPWQMPVPISISPEILGVDIPEGIHSLHFITDSRAPVRLVVTGPERSQFGSVRYLLRDGEQLFMPDERRVPVYLLGAQKRPLTLDVPASESILERVMRLDLRLFEEPDERSKAFAANLTVDFLAADGKVLMHETRALESPEARFEFLEAPEAVLAPEEEALPPGVEIHYHVSEPVSARFVAPRLATTLRLTADGPIAVRGYAFLPAENLLELPYRDVETLETRWRYAPLEQRTWFPLHPVNRTELIENGQHSDLVAQTRLIPRGELEGDAVASDLMAVAVVPLGQPERHTILEPVPREKWSRTLWDWGGNTLAELLPGRVHQFAFGRASSARPRLIYWADEKPSGQAVEVRIDGKPAKTVQPDATRGRWQLPRLAPGAHTVQVVTATEGLRVFIDQPPGRGDRPKLFNLRTVYPLDRRGLRLQVSRKTRDAVMVNMIAYARTEGADPDVQLHATVDRGRPRRLEGVPFSRLTVAERTTILPAANRPHRAVLPDQGGATAGYPRLVAIPIGEDVAAGTHLIDVKTMSGGTVWVRFFITGRQSERMERALQWQFYGGDSSEEDAAE